MYLSFTYCVYIQIILNPMTIENLIIKQHFNEIWFFEYSIFNIFSHNLLLCNFCLESIILEYHHHSFCQCQYLLQIKEETSMCNVFRLFVELVMHFLPNIPKSPTFFWVQDIKIVKQNLEKNIFLGILKKLYSFLGKEDRNWKINQKA